MARGRAAGYGDQLAAIAAQAARLFARHGYAATSVQQVADACGLSKASLYHYVPTKQALLVVIADTHVSRLQALVDEQTAQARATGLAPEPHLRNLITSLVHAYAGAQHAHRVLTEDVRFLEPAARERVLDKERGVVRGFASAVAVLRPDLQTADHQTHLAKPLTMLLFGMVNWMFTWMKPGGALDHEAIAPLVADLFIGGLGALRAPPSQPRTQAIVAPARRRPTPAPTPVSRKIRSQPKETSA